MADSPQHKPSGSWGLSPGTWARYSPNRKVVVGAVVVLVAFSLKTLGPDLEPKYIFAAQLVAMYLIPNRG